MDPVLQLATGRLSATALAVTDDVPDGGDAAAPVCWWTPAVHDAVQSLVLDVVGDTGQGSDALLAVCAAIASAVGDTGVADAGDAGEATTATAGFGSTHGAINKRERLALQAYTHMFAAATLQAPPVAAPVGVSSTPATAVVVPRVWPGLLRASTSNRGAEYCSSLLSVTSSLCTLAQATPGAGGFEGDASDAALGGGTSRHGRGGKRRMGAADRLLHSAVAHLASFAAPPSSSAHMSPRQAAAVVDRLRLAADVAVSRHLVPFLSHHNAEVRNECMFAAAQLLAKVAASGGGADGGGGDGDALGAGATAGGGESAVVETLVHACALPFASPAAVAALVARLLDRSEAVTNKLAAVQVLADIAQAGLATVEAWAPCRALAVVHLTATRRRSSGARGTSSEVNEVAHVAGSLLMAIAAGRIARPLLPLLRVSSRRVLNWLEDQGTPLDRDGGDVGAVSLAGSVAALHAARLDAEAIAADLMLDAWWRPDGTTTLPTGLGMGDEESADAELALRRVVEVLMAAAPAVREAIARWAMDALGSGGGVDTTPSQQQQQKGGAAPGTGAPAAGTPSVGGSPVPVVPPPAELANAVALWWWWLRFAWSVGVNVDATHSLLSPARRVAGLVLGLVRWATAASPLHLMVALGGFVAPGHAAYRDEDAEGEGAPHVLTEHPWPGTALLSIMGQQLPVDRYSANALRLVQAHVAHELVDVVSAFVCLESESMAGRGPADMRGRVNRRLAWWIMTQLVGTCRTAMWWQTARCRVWLWRWLWLWSHHVDVAVGVFADAGVCFHYTALLTASVTLYTTAVRADAVTVQLAPLWPALAAGSAGLWCALLAAASYHGVLRQQLAVSGAVEALLTAMMPVSTRIAVEDKVPPQPFMPYQGTYAMRYVVWFGFGAAAAATAPAVRVADTMSPVPSFVVASRYQAVFMLHVLCGQLGWDREHLLGRAGHHVDDAAVGDAAGMGWQSSGLASLPAPIARGVAALLSHRRALHGMGVGVGVTPSHAATASAGRGDAVGGAAVGAATTQQVVARGGDPLSRDLVRQVLRYVCGSLVIAARGWLCPPVA